MYVGLYLHRLGCQPVEPRDIQQRRRRRLRLYVLIVVAAVVTTLTFDGYTVATAVSAIAGVVAAARLVTRFLTGPDPAPATGR